MDYKLREKKHLKIISLFKNYFVRLSYKRQAVEREYNLRLDSTQLVL